MSLPVARMVLGSVRRMSSSSKVQALRSRESSSWKSSTAAKPVFKKDVPPLPTPPPSPPAPTPATRSVAQSPLTTRGGGKPGSIYASYQALPYNTKVVFWTCGAMFAALGLLAADKLEELFPAHNNKNRRPRSTSSDTEAEAAAGAKFISHPDPTPSSTSASTPSANTGEGEVRKPKLFSISVVDRS